MENQEILVAVGAIIGALMSGVQIIGKWREEHRAEAKNNPRNAWKGRLASFAERLTQLVVVTVDHIPCSYMTVLVQRAPQGPIVVRSLEGEGCRAEFLCLMVHGVRYAISCH